MWVEGKHRTATRNLAVGAGGAHSSAQGGKTTAQRGSEVIFPSPAIILVLRLVWEQLHLPLRRQQGCQSCPHNLQHEASAKAPAEPLNTSQLPGIAGCNRLKRQLHKKQNGRGKTHSPTLPGAKEGGRVCSQDCTRLSRLDRTCSLPQPEPARRRREEQETCRNSLPFT